MSNAVTGAELIAQERERQVHEEGWDANHDRWHSTWELARAARCYAIPLVRANTEMPILWPWSGEWWKPSDDPIRNLVKAGALIAAEIDRQVTTRPWRCPSCGNENPAGQEECPCQFEPDPGPGR